MDVGQDTTLGDGDVSQQLVQLLIVADGELEMSGDDTGLLVVAGGVASQLENLGSKVLEDGSEVNGGTGTDTLGVVALAEQTVDTADGESQTSLGRTATEVGSATAHERGPEPTRWSRSRAKCNQDASPRVKGRLKAVATRTRRRWRKAGVTYDCEFLEPLALPPDLPPPVILMDVWVGGVGKRSCLESEDERRWRCWRSGVGWLWAEDGLCWLKTRKAVEVQWGRELK